MSYSQNQLDEFSYPYSQAEFSDSQDSGYAVVGIGRQPASFRPNVLQQRRTLSRPPTWPNAPPVNVQEGYSRIKYTFVGREEMGKSALERDLSIHLDDLAKKAKQLPVKMSRIVEESVKYLQKSYERDNTFVEQEITRNIVKIVEELLENNVAVEQVVNKIDILKQELKNTESRIQAVLANKKKMFETLSTATINIASLKMEIENLNETINGSSSCSSMKHSRTLQENYSDSKRRACIRTSNRTTRKQLPSLRQVPE